MNPGKISVLLVEDDNVDYMNVKRAFKKNELTYPLYRAENGLDALDMLRGNRQSEFSKPPNIILLDINMPQMNGIEFLKELRLDPQLKNTVVIILTTSNDEKDLFDAYNLAVQGYILKPVTFDAFQKAIATLNDYWILCETPDLIYGR